MISSRMADCQEKPGPDGAAGIGSVEVLVVDDSPGICRFLETVLSRNGFQVWLASDGEEALDHLKRRAGSIRFAFVDISMPRKSGPATIQAMRQLGLDVPFVFMSGCLGNFELPELMLLGPQGLLPKPFGLKEVLTSVRELLPDNGCGEG